MSHPTHPQRRGRPARRLVPARRRARHRRPRWWAAAAPPPRSLSPAGSQSCQRPPAIVGSASPAAGSASPAPDATITAGPVPAAAARAAVRYWRLIDAHRYHALLGVVTADSSAAAAVRAGQADGFWGIKRVRVVSTAATADPAPPAGATIEFEMTIEVTPSASSAWNAGRTLVFMNLRRVGDRWLVYESGTGP